MVTNFHNKCFQKYLFSTYQLNPLMCCSFSFQNTPMVLFKYGKKTESIPIEEYRGKTVLLKSEVVIQWPSY